MKALFIYPPTGVFQRGEDRCQANVESSTAINMRACNDLGLGAAVTRIVCAEHAVSCEVQIRDFPSEGASFDDAVAEVCYFEPDLLLVSVTNATIYEDLRFISEVREWCDCCVVAKGAIFWGMPGTVMSMLDVSCCDFLIGGEVDVCLRPVIRYCLFGRVDATDFVATWFKVDGVWQHGQFGAWEEDLDSLPWPDRSVMPNEFYVRPDTGNPMATIQVGRGCFGRCTYCLTPLISGRCVRLRSPENVVAEMRECVEVYGIHDFFLRADTFTADGDWVSRLCQLIRSDEVLSGNISWTANARVKPLSGDTLYEMAAAGCFCVAFGFESGSDDTLRRIRKGATAADNVQAAKWARKAGLQTYGFWMIGFPWDDEEHIADTIKCMYECDTDFVEIHIALPYVGTEFYNECASLGVLSGKAVGYDYFHASTVDVPGFEPGELERLRLKELRKYYMRPKSVLRKASYVVRHPSAFAPYAKRALALLHR